MLRSLSLLLAAFLTLVPAYPAPAQAVVQGGGGGTRARYSTGQSLTWLLYNPQLQKEIEIVDDQKAELEKIQKEMAAKTTEAYKSLGDQAGDPLERQKKYMEVYQKLGRETEERIGKVLLPHQKKRLSQIMLQMKLQQSGYGFASALEADDIAKELGITDAQKEEMKKKEEKLRADIQKKYQEFYKKLQDETREELLSVLTPAQRIKLEDLTGQKFEWQQWQPAQPVGGAAKPAEKKGD